MRNDDRRRDDGSASAMTGGGRAPSAPNAASAPRVIDLGTTRYIPGARTLTAGLLLAGAGVLVQYLTGVPGFPTIPPGPIVLVVAGLLVIFVRSRVGVFVGTFAAAFVSTGAIVASVANPDADIVGRLLAVGDVGPFIGTATQVLGLLLALGGGVVAMANLRRPADV